MMRSWWPLGCAAAFLLCSSAGVADAQTVIVRGAPAAAALEVSFGTAVAKGTADQAGGATVVLTDSPAITQEIAAAIYADTCGTIVRLLLVPRTQEPPAPGGGCQRRLVPGFFVFRRETSVVVDLAPGVPIVRIRQGSVPGSWLKEGPIPIGRVAPRGIVVFGGGGIATMSDTLDVLCGNTSPCARENTKFNFMFGGAYWLTPWLAAEGMFIKAAEFKVEGTGDQHEMIGSAEPRMLTAAAVGGLPVRSARFYGRIGGSFSRVRVETTQATFNQTISIDGGTVTYPASTQTFVFETEGWGLLFGGGVEGWVSDTVALFAEANFVDIDGKNAGLGGPREVKDSLRSLIAGVRVHLGRRR